MCSCQTFSWLKVGRATQETHLQVCLIALVRAGNSRYSGNTTGTGLEKDSFQTTQLQFVRTVVFSITIRCRLVSDYQRFRRTYRLHLQGIRLPEELQDYKAS
jgi:hypothetical protein